MTLNTRYYQFQCTAQFHKADMHLPKQLISLSDPSIFSFTETSQHVFSETATNGISFSFTLKNNEATGKNADVNAVTGSDFNFALTLFYSTNDVTSASAIHAAVTPTLASSAVLQAALPAQGTLSGSGTANMPLTSSCTTADFLCLQLNKGTGASYGTDKDVTQTSNTKCIDITARRSCKPGEYDRM